MSATFAPRPRIVARRVPLAPSHLRGDVLAFLVPAACSFSLSFIGQIPYGEALLLLALPFLLIKKRYEAFRKDYRIIYVLMGLWLASQIVTDIYVDAPRGNRIKGIARIVFFALDLAGISCLIGTSRRRMCIFALGIATSNLVFVRGIRTYGMDFDWKMFLGLATSIVVELFASYLYLKRRYIPIGLLTLMLAGANLYFGTRSGVLFDLTTFFLIMPLFRGGSEKDVEVHSALYRSPLFRVTVLGVLAMVAIWGSERAIRWGVGHGIYDAEQSQKFETQAGGKLGVLFGGRPEVLVAAQAIADSPILGHGSYAVDPKYVVMLQDYRYEMGYAEYDTPDEEITGIPTHSHLTMAWVEAGVLGSFLWFYLLILIGRAVVRITWIDYPLAPLAIFLFITFFWDILFSPFGETRRIFESFFIVLVVDVMRTGAVLPAARALRPPLKRIYRGTPNRPVLPRLPRPTIGLRFGLK